MPLTRAKKTEKVKALASELEHSTSAIVGTFTGLTAAKDYDLRKAVRGAGGSYHVVKNKLAARAAQGHQDRGGAAGTQGRLVGGVHLGRSGGAGQGAGRLGEGERGVHLQAGHRRWQGASRSRRSRRWPRCRARKSSSRKLLFLIQSPAQRLVTVINAAGRDLAVVINQGVEKGKFAGRGGCRAAGLPKRRLRKRRLQKPVVEAPQPKHRCSRSASRRGSGG